jgi:hypothetical protein
MIVEIQTRIGKRWGTPKMLCRRTDPKLKDKLQRFVHSHVRGQIWERDPRTCYGRMIGWFEPEIVRVNLGSGVTLTR